MPATHHPHPQSAPGIPSGYDAARAAPGALIPRAEVQRLYSVLTYHYLTRLAHEGRGPAYHRIAGKALYAVEDLEAFIASCRVVPGERRAPVTPPAPTVPVAAPTPALPRKRGRPRKIRSRPRPAPIGAEG